MHNNLLAELSLQQLRETITIREKIEHTAVPQSPERRQPRAPLWMTVAPSARPSAAGVRASVIAAELATAGSLLGGFLWASADRIEALPSCSTFLRARNCIS